MVLVGSHGFSVVLSRFSYVLNCSRRFSMVLSGSGQRLRFSVGSHGSRSFQGSRCFSVVLVEFSSGSQWFSQVLCRCFSVVLSRFSVASQWFLLVLIGSQWFS